MSSITLKNITIFHQVDNFVQEILFKSVDISQVTTELNQLYASFWLIYDDNYHYSQSIIAFIGATKAVVGHILPYEVVWTNETANRFLKWLNTYQKNIQRVTQQQAYQEKQNLNQLTEYVEQLTTHYSRLLFVRVDLAYRATELENVTIDEFYEHIKKLQELISNRQTCFEGLQGHAWAIEQGGKESHLHCHLLLIYDGAKRQKDYHLGVSVGLKWLLITQKKGSYFNCNTHQCKKHYQQLGLLGIGMIHRDNLFEVKNAIYTASYLAKPEKYNQHPCIRIPRKRTFGRGQYNVAWRRNRSNSHAHNKKNSNI